MKLNFPMRIAPNTRFVYNLYVNLLSQTADQMIMMNIDADGKQSSFCNNIQMPHTHTIFDSNEKIQTILSTNNRLHSKHEIVAFVYFSENFQCMPCSRYIICDCTHHFNVNQRDECRDVCQVAQWHRFGIRFKRMCVCVCVFPIRLKWNQAIFTEINSNI